MPDRPNGNGQTLKAALDPPKWVLGMRLSTLPHRKISVKQK
jgi:hypothetical protein